MSRIYHVRNIATGQEQLVNAGLPAQVLRHVAKSLFDIKPVKQPDLVRLLTQDNPLKVEQASAEDDPKPDTQGQGTSGADATGGQPTGTPEGAAQGGDDASANLGEGVAQPDAQAQDGFQADAGTEAASTSRKRR